MERNEVSPREQFVEIDFFDAEILCAFQRQERIVGNHLHMQANGSIGNDRPDIAAADEAQNLAGELHAHEAVFFPFAGLR
jgi:hypothetical protein